MYRFLLIAAFLTACAAVPVRSAALPLVEPMHWLSLPVELRVSEQLDDCQRAAVAAGSRYLETRAGRPLFVPTTVPSTDPAVLGIPVPGVISVAPTTALSTERTLGEAVRFLYVGTRVLHYANIEVVGCSTWVAAHELGHALGLEHVNTDSTALMFPVQFYGWSMSAAEIKHLRRGL